jgi:hypothetical protein
VEHPKVRDYTEDVGIDGKITLELILEKLGEKVWTGFIWLKVRTNGSLL